MTILATPTYTSRTSLFLTIESAASTGELNSGTSYTESQVKNFAKVATAPVVLRRVLDTRVRSAEDVAAVTDVPLVGTVAFDQDAASRPLVVLSDPTSSRSEDFRRLRTNLQFLAIGDRGIAFSSSLEAEGKSSTVINCALALGSANKRVLLIDADLRRPRVAKRMNIEGSVGLTTVLIGRARLDDVVQPVFDGLLDVLPAGRIPPNPSELLGSDAMRRVLAEATATYDYVLLDTAPLVPVTDTAVLSSLIGGVVLVVGSGDVHAAQLTEAIDSVRAAEGQVLGILLNKLRSEDAGYRSSYYYGREGYGDQPEPNNTPEVPQTAPAQVDDQPAPTQLNELVSESSHRTPARAAQ